MAALGIDQRMQASLETLAKVCASGKYDALKVAEFLATVARARMEGTPEQLAEIRRLIADKRGFLPHEWTDRIKRIMGWPTT